MNIWDVYQKRSTANGETKRERSLNNEVRVLKKLLPDNLSYHQVEIDNEQREIAIINTDNLNIKNIYSLPKENITCGSTVYWMGNYWLVSEKDANNELYTRAKMIQCNHLLKWIDDSGEICEQWCVIEDGTKYLTGELEDRNFVVTRGDTRIAMTITRNEKTAKFNRESRFLIDDDTAEVKLSYALTKPFKVGWTYDNEGVYKFVLQEVNSTEEDNHLLGIADYYKYYKKDNNYDNKHEQIINPENTTEDGKKVWL